MNLWEPSSRRYLFIGFRSQKAEEYRDPRLEEEEEKEIRVFLNVGDEDGE
ncbi:hypothetical protein F2Q69_00045027 [Brassica cretica]|uniref:Uncharacterized protein n=1 Tax=Brassica cretica TaxID=69181 RepID=A0A8S9NSB8_BRACR|nr:hypothetical protein F2Q69_00045027 [Brassica cretica]